MAAISVFSAPLCDMFFRIEQIDSLLEKLTVSHGGTKLTEEVVMTAISVFSPPLYDMFFSIEQIDSLLEKLTVSHGDTELTEEMANGCYLCVLCASV